MKNFKLLVSLCFLVVFGTFAQENSIVKNVPFTNIGPTIMSGRVVDFDVNPDNPVEFYVAYASGGLWYTNNNGTSFNCVSDTAPTQNMGDIAVDWNKGTIWIGTGESNSSRSSYAGIGILKSDDKGKSWINVGLKDSHHIGRIVINPNNPNEVTVGVIGHLYTPNKERGIFKTTNGGKTWKNVLFINNQTGVIDISVSPTDANTMYAATWERERKAWDFDGDGEGSGIYKSTDGGNTWFLITNENCGFPIGSGVGRIGLAAFNNDVIYALLDNQFRRPVEKEEDNDELKKDDFKKMSKNQFLKLDDKKLNTYLRSNRFERKHTAKSVKKEVRDDNIVPNDLAIYLENANAALFDSPVIGAEVYKSTDGGKSWNKTHEGYLDGVYSSYGYYFGIMAVHAKNQNKIYIGGVPILKSDDGGKNFTDIGKENVHSDHQALWVNPNVEGHVINGNDGGVNITYDDGENWTKNNSPSVGQYYAINVDNKKPYNVYGGLQDNGVWYGPSNYTASKNWESGGQYPYKRIGGGDGMQVQVDNRGNNIVYSGSQFGFYFRLNTETGERLSINPKHELGDSPYRYNWQTPILLSPHNQDILYMGANKLLRSMDQGETFDVISSDLTTGGKKGNVPYGTLATISESPFQFGMIYTGSDDGYINLTTNGGSSWSRVSDNLPQGLWVSRVIASQHKKERVYATLNGYRNDDFKVYVYVSENMGKTWKSITKGISDSPVNVIKEDTKDENILYLGTDDAAYVSFNKGGNWHAFSNGLSNAAVHDLVVHPDANDLVVGTHGRSIYRANISALQSFSKVGSNAITIFDIEPIHSSPRWGSSWGTFYPINEPSITIAFYSNAKATQGVNILSEGGVLLNSIKVNTDKGFNYADYDLTISSGGRDALMKENTKVNIPKAQNGKYYLPKGTYTVQIGSKKTKLKVK
jgi:photosystem II stability/assembly factor-like uncharacterized protein